MKILAFETSAKAGSVALLEDGILLSEAYQNTGLTHSQTVLPMAQQLLENCGLTPKDIDAVAVAAGPGSFTGIRIGVAAAKGFAWGGELPCYGVSTLEAMALQLGLTNGYICAAMDARRSQVYNAIFCVKECKLERICQDRAISLEDLATDLSKITEPVYLVGDGAELTYRTLADSCCQLRLPPEHRRHQRAAGVALAAWQQFNLGIPADAATLTPNYLRLSQAERERLAREEKEKQGESL